MWCLTRQSVVAVAVVVASQACGIDGVPTRPEDATASINGVAALAANEVARSAEGRTERGFEDDILRLEARVPGVGGVYVDSLGRTVVYVKSLADADAATREWRSAASHLQLADAHTARMAAADGVVPREGRFSFSELVAWQKVLLVAIGREKGFVSIDADEMRNRVSVTVSDDSTVMVVRTRAMEIGMPEDAVDVQVGPRSEVAHSLRTTVRPVSGSYQIANYWGYCTLGWNLHITWVGKVFLTAGHCSAAAPGSGATGSGVDPISWTPHSP